MTENGYYSITKLRRSILHFAGGKLVNGTLGLSTLLLIARELPAEQYGAYLVIISVANLVTGASLMGLDAIGNMYVPRYRVHAGVVRLFRFILALLGARAITLLLCAIFVFFAAPLLASFFGIDEWVRIIRLYTTVVFISGLATFLRSAIFEPLLLQHASQVTIFARGSVFVGLLLAISVQDVEAGLEDVVLAEVAGAGASAIVGFLCLLFFWRDSKYDRTNSGEWKAPRVASMIKSGMFDQISYVMQLSGNTQAILLVAGRMLGSTATAGFGFALMLADQLKQYLPGEVLAPVVRPKMVASYSVDADFRALNRRGMMLFKLSLFLLAPVVVIFLANGAGTLSLLSGGRYGDHVSLMLLLLVATIPLSHRTILFAISASIERLDIFALGGIANLVTVPLCIVLLSMGAGPIGLACAVLFSAVLYNGIVLRRLASAGFKYSFDYTSCYKILLAACGAAAILFLTTQADARLLVVSFISVGAVGLFLFFAWLLKPFSSHERSLVKQSMRLKLFVR